MNQKRCILTVAMMLLSVAGCHKIVKMEQEVLDKSVAPEAVKGAAEEKTCGTETMRADDAEKWDCVPEKGYWCTDPEGCPYDGSTFQAGMRLKYAFPLPQGKGYLYTGKIGYVDSHGFADVFGGVACASDEGCKCGKKKIAKGAFCYDDKNHHKNQSGWACALDDGCVCGQGKIVKGAFCSGDMYAAEDAVAGACNKNNCPVLCREDKCVYRDIEIPPDKFGYESVKRYREKNLEICVRDSGCTDFNGDERALGETRYLNTGFIRFIDFVNCMQDEGCTCGNERCKKEESCKNGSMCLGDTRKKANDDAVFECEDANGCKCGHQLCPEGYWCSDGLCEYRFDEEGYSAEIFYCDKPDGCTCGTEHTRCPQGAMCGTETFCCGGLVKAHLCESVSNKYKDSKVLFEFLKSNNPKVSKNSEDKPKNAIERFLYSRKSDAEIKNSKKIISLDMDYEDQPHEMVIRNGKWYGWPILCSKPGCDCAGEPLKEGYMCLEQTPYLYEQVCFDDQGCKCGDNIIMVGDICVDGRAQCGASSDRLGCMCGDTELKDKDYRCYAGRFRCQSKKCKCGNEIISNSDFCDNGQAVCGEESSSEGCLCGGMPLRKGYKCDGQMQRCNCKFVVPPKVERNDDDEEEEDYYEEEEDYYAWYETLRTTCTCPCGTEQIGYGFGCLKDDTSEKLPKIEVLESDDLLKLSCGDKELIIKRDDLMFMRVLSKTGEYRDERYINYMHPEDNGLFCTCGTGKPIPGDHYGCALETYAEYGKGSEWSMRHTFKGYQCLSFDGCACGEDTCLPGDICDISDNGSMKCQAFRTFDGTCGNHQLPPSLVYHGGYACYSQDSTDFAKGWYCQNQDGCACGDIRCEYGHMCLVPGYCSKNKVALDGLSFKFPKIELD